MDTKLKYIKLDYGKEPIKKLITRYKKRINVLQDEKKCFNSKLLKAKNDILYNDFIEKIENKISYIEDLIEEYSNFVKHLKDIDFEFNCVSKKKKSIFNKIKLKEIL